MNTLEIIHDRLSVALDRARMIRADSVGEREATFSDVRADGLREAIELIADPRNHMDSFRTHRLTIDLLLTFNTILEGLEKIPELRPEKTAEVRELIKGLIEGMAELVPRGHMVSLKSYTGENRHDTEGDG